MKKRILTIALAAFSCASVRAVETPPAFPKLSVEYYISIPVMRVDRVSQEQKSKGYQDREYLSLDSHRKSVIFDRWLGGSWYAVTYLSAGNSVDQTNVNISQLLTLEEATDKGAVTKRIEEKAARKIAAAKRAARQAAWEKARAEKVAASRARVAAMKAAEEQAAAERAATENK